MAGCRFLADYSSAYIRIELFIAPKLVMLPKKFYIPQQETVHEVTDEEIASAPKTILLLEDDPSTVEVLTQFLQAHSYRVMTAKDGVQGLKYIMASDYDIVICDMMMPNLPGDMFYLAVERTKPHMAKRFLFITGYASDQRIRAFISKIKGLILFKPFDMQLLLDNISLVLKKNSQSSATAGGVAR